MIKVTQVTTHADGKVTVQGAEIESMDETGVRKHLGTGEKFHMDACEKTFAHGKPVVSIALAQEAVWSYVTHVFVMA